jgi:hypothetical protein
MYVKMCGVTEDLRGAIQRYEDISYLQTIDFFHQHIRSSETLVQFLSLCADEDEEYEVGRSDAVFLSYHIQSGNDLADFTDMDIKEMLCPIDMNFQKPVPRNTFYKSTSDPRSTETAFNQTNQGCFLGKTYQKVYHKN